MDKMITGFVFNPFEFFRQAKSVGYNDFQAEFLALRLMDFIYESLIPNPQKELKMSPNDLPTKPTGMAMPPILTPSKEQAPSVVNINHIKELSALIYREFEIAKAEIITHQRIFMGCVVGVMLCCILFLHGKI